MNPEVVQLWVCIWENPEERTTALMPKFPECNVCLFFRIVERQIKFPFMKGAKMRHDLTLCETQNC